MKTFVLSLGASLGLMLSIWGGAYDAWHLSSEEFCDSNFVAGKWWRIPIYLACSVAVLGQYRMQLDRYFFALLVQLAAYEVQYSVSGLRAQNANQKLNTRLKSSRSFDQVYNAISEDYTNDNLDTAASNILGCAAGVLSACSLTWFMNTCRKFYNYRIINKDCDDTGVKTLVYRFMRMLVKVFSFLGLHRQSEIKKLTLKQKLSDQSAELNDPSHPRNRIDKDVEFVFLETVVGSQSVNTWSLLMPAVYQLVPGSMIARMWFQSIFPSDTDFETGTFSNLMGECNLVSLSFQAIKQCLTSFARCCNAQSSPHRWRLVLSLGSRLYKASHLWLTNYQTLVERAMMKMMEMKRMLTDNG